MASLLFGLNDYGYRYGYDDYSGAIKKIEWMVTSGMIAFFLALIVTIVAFVVLLPANKRKGLKGFALWLHDFLNFKVLFVEAILKFLYVFATAGTIIYCVLNMFNRDFLIWFLGMIVAFIIIRISYELLMLTVILVTNVIQINNKLKGDAGKVDMFQRDIDLNKFVPKQTMQQGFGQPLNQQYTQNQNYAQGTEQQAFPNQPQQAAPMQVEPNQASGTQNSQQAAPQEQQAYPKFCKTCGSPIDQSTGKCPNCDK